MVVDLTCDDDDEEVEETGGGATKALADSLPDQQQQQQQQRGGSGKSACQTSLPNQLAKPAAAAAGGQRHSRISQMPAPLNNSKCKRGGLAYNGGTAAAFDSTADTSIINR